VEFDVDLLYRNGLRYHQQEPTARALLWAMKEALLKSLHPTETSRGVAVERRFM
jgi:phosphopantetheinyl transferase (holo-ACP synthase)